MRKKQVKIIGGPMDLGGGRRGVDMGPSVVRVANLNQKVEQLGYEVEDYGNVSVIVPETLRITDRNQKFLPEIAAANREMREKAERAMKAGAIPIMLGGDHSMAIGSIAGVASYYRKKEKRIGLMWFDAHADMNTPETTPSGNIHGMPFAVVLGMGAPELTEIAGFVPMVDPKVSVLIGARSIDETERQTVIESGVRVFSMRELDERGMSAVMEEALSIVTNDTIGFHVSLDMDFFDPDYAPGVGTRVSGGTTYREGHLAMEKIADSGRLTSLDLVEINPVLDSANRTAEFGVELICSALGKKIL